MEQEVEMWKNTAKVYKRRYETMRNLALVNASFAAAIAVLMLIMRLLK